MIFLRGAVIALVISLFVYCFKKLDRHQRKIRIIVLIVGDVACSLLSIIAAVLDGEDVFTMMCIVFFSYLLWLGWRIVLDIIFLCKRKSNHTTNGTTSVNDKTNHKEQK